MVSGEIIKTVTISAHVSQVWKALTDLSMMKEWMTEPEMELEITT
jgi:uncharacterized protein YndB with AHSA1/START domain